MTNSMHCFCNNTAVRRLHNNLMLNQSYSSSFSAVLLFNGKQRFIKFHLYSSNVTTSVETGHKELGVRCRKAWNFAQRSKFKTDFHPKISVCRHELPPPLRQFQHWWPLLIMQVVQPMEDIRSLALLLRTVCQIHSKTLLCNHSLLAHWACLTCQSAPTF